MFLQCLGVVADVFGILSFVLGLVTLAMTVGIKKSLLKHIEKSDYLQDIDAQVAELKSFYDTLLKDDSLYNEILLQRIDAQLEDVYIGYETILPKKFLAEIAKLRNHIKNRCLRNLEDRRAKQDCINQIHSIYTRLRKEKKLL